MQKGRVITATNLTLCSPSCCKWKGAGYEYILMDVISLCMSTIGCILYKRIQPSSKLVRSSDYWNYNTDPYFYSRVAVISIELMKTVPVCPGAS